MIANPISLAEIKPKIDNKEYTTVEACHKDLNLMLENAREYNESDSWVHGDATTLQEMLTEKMETMHARTDMLEKYKVFMKEKKAAEKLLGIAGLTTDGGLSKSIAGSNGSVDAAASAPTAGDAGAETTGTGAPPTRTGGIENAGAGDDAAATNAGKDGGGKDTAGATAEDKVGAAGEKSVPANGAPPTSEAVAGSAEATQGSSTGDNSGGSDGASKSNVSDTSERQAAFLVYNRPEPKCTYHEEAIKELRDSMGEVTRSMRTEFFGRDRFHNMYFMMEGVPGLHVQQDLDSHAESIALLTNKSWAHIRTDMATGDGDDVDDTVRAEGKADSGEQGRAVPNGVASGHSAANGIAPTASETMNGTSMQVDGQDESTSDTAGTNRGGKLVESEAVTAGSSVVKVEDNISSSDPVVRSQSEVVTKTHTDDVTASGTVKIEEAPGCVSPNTSPLKLGGEESIGFGGPQQFEQESPALAAIREQHYAANTLASAWSRYVEEADLDVLMDALHLQGAREKLLLETLTGRKHAILESMRAAREELSDPERQQQISFPPASQMESSKVC